MADIDSGRGADGEAADRERALRRLLLLAAAAAAYVLAAWSTPPGFYDGFAPATPYNWISPPPQARAGNKQPATGHLVVPVSGGQTNPVGVATDDGQAQVLLPKNAFSLSAGAISVTIDIKPVAQHPAAGEFLSATNVYLYTASAPLAQPVTITLRYALDVTPPSDVYFSDPGSAGWTRLPPEHASPHFVAATAHKLGYFAAGSVTGATGNPAPGGEPPSTSVPVLPLVAGGAIALVVLAGLPFLVQRRTQRQARTRKGRSERTVPPPPNLGGRRRKRPRRKN